MTVNIHLTTTASNLVLSSDENTSIRTSISTLASRLDSYFSTNITEHFQFGSNTRGTILPRMVDSNSDVDYMVVFDTSSGEKKPQTYLDRLRTFAEKRYSSSEIAQSSPTIKLSLNHIRFELVPAISNYGYGYKIPSPASAWTDWTQTDPNGANQELIDKNKNNDNQIKPLVRLVKYWNAINGHPYTSFSLEKYIVDRYFYSSTSLKNYFYEFWEGFNANYDVAQTTKDKVARAKRIAQNAKQYEADGMEYSAESEIKRLIPEL